MNSFERLNKPPFTKTLYPETLALHGREPVTSPAVPIWQTAWNEDLGAASPRFAHEALNAIYPSVSNPTQAILEERLAAFEGGAAALAFSSGQAASVAVVLNVARVGDNFVTSTDLYGGTWVLFSNTLRELGIEARFVDPSDPENFRRATDDRTRLYYAETLPNPKLNVFPIGEVAEIGRALGVPLVMDNTASPLIVRPLEHGAAVVLYSTTKYIGGHGTTIGGAIIDGGTFPWMANAGRFPLLTEPDDEHPDLIWTEIANPLGRLRLHFARASNCSAIWARPCRRLRPSRFCRGWTHCQFVWSSTAPTQLLLRTTLRCIPESNKCTSRACSLENIAAGPMPICAVAMARSSASS